MNKTQYSEIKQKLIEKGIFFSNRLNIERFHNETILTYKKGFKLEEGCAILTGTQLPFRMGIGSYTWSSLPITSEIGRYCSIAKGVNILGNRHPIEAVTSSPIMYDLHFSIVRYIKKEYNYIHPKHTNPQKGNKIEIHHDVWIGERASIAKGLTIHTGAVIASDSVVTKDVPPYTIVGGNPAKIIRKRFTEDIIEKLLESEWWNYSPEYLSKFNLSEPEKFLTEFYKDKGRKINFKIFSEEDIIFL